MQASKQAGLIAGMAVIWGLSSPALATDTYAQVIALPEATPKPFLRAPVRLENLRNEFGGYIKANGIFSYYSDGDVATPSSGRDYFRPNSIPVATGTASESSAAHLDAHAKDTRVWLTSQATLDGIAVSARLEADFRLSEQGNEVVSNSYSPRLRRAFVRYGHWLIGQEWTVFRNHAANPESLDSLGVTDGLIFGRQPQLRYSRAGFTFSLENNELSLLSFGGGKREVTGDAVLPDLHLRRDWQGDWGQLSLAGMVRHLVADKHPSGQAEPAASLVDDTVFGYGLSLAGKIPLADKDDLRFMLSGGEGIGRYLAIATSADAVATERGTLEAIPVVNGLLAYRHVWAPRWRSTLALSGLLIDNEPALTGTTLTKSVRSVRANLIYAPAAAITMGFELLYAERHLQNGQFGNHLRPQVSFKYGF